MESQSPKDGKREVPATKLRALKKVLEDGTCSVRDTKETRREELEAATRKELGNRWDKRIREFVSDSRGTSGTTWHAKDPVIPRSLRTMRKGKQS